MNKPRHTVPNLKLCIHGTHAIVIHNGIGTVYSDTDEAIKACMDIATQDHHNPQPTTQPHMAGPVYYTSEKPIPEPGPGVSSILVCACPEAVHGHWYVIHAIRTQGNHWAWYRPETDADAAVDCLNKNNCVWMYVPVVDVATERSGEPVASVTSRIYRLPATPLPPPNANTGQLLVAENIDSSDPHWTTIYSHRCAHSTTWKWFADAWPADVEMYNQSEYYWMFAPDSERVSWEKK